MQIPYIDLAFQYNQQREEILAAIDDVLKSGQYILGPQVELFEKRMSELCGVKHAIAVADGTESLMLIMKVMGLGPGDEVITAPNSWISSASSITHVGATPVFVDVSSDQNINPALIEKAITKKTKAIMPVHLTGKMADMKPILEVAKKYNLYVIEDAAQAVGAKYHGQPAGSVGHAASFSLHPLKNLNAAGDGGLITTDNDHFAEQIKLLRNHGIVDRENIKTWGYNSRLDSVQAAILNVRLKYLDQVTEKRRYNSELYRKLLTQKVRCPEDADGCFDVYHLFVIQVARRNELKAYLQTKGITTAIHYPVPIHLYKAAEELGYSRGSFPVCEAQSNEILSLPIHQGITDEHIEYISSHINTFMEQL